MPHLHHTTLTQVLETLKNRIAKNEELTSTLTVLIVAIATVNQTFYRPLTLVR
jgi:hypothetical protein